MRDGYRDVTACRVCGASRFTPVLDLGETPLANALVVPRLAADPEPRYPLAVIRCAECTLIQLSGVVDPVRMFAHYLYASSASAPAVAHFEEYANDVAQRFARPGAFVVEIGSNDGILLHPLQQRGLRVLGVEPSDIAAVANAAGLETINGFFSEEIAARIVAERGHAAAVVANNVLAHIDDLDGVMRGLDTLLAPDGEFIAEVPYLADLVDRVEYDTIYHEHLSYFALGPLCRLFERHGFELFDVRRVAVHGGSIRMYAGRPGRGASDALRVAVADEDRRGFNDGSALSAFADAVARSREALRALLSELRARNSRVAALGATAKGNTLLNYCGIGTELVEYVADSTPQKQGLLTPGMHIPIRAESALAVDPPSHTLLLAWNWADAILERFHWYTDSGGRFIHPIPIARVIPS
jgi:SAM-dependent methyltransferase